MTRIALATASADLEARFRAATGGAFIAMPPPPVLLDPARVSALLHEAPVPEVLVLDAGELPEQALALAALVDEHSPHIAIVLIADHAAALSLSALRAGVRDILHPRADLAEVQAALARAAQAAESRALPRVNPTPARPTGRVISVISPKGGVGKTTVATNLAVGLARSAADSTVLVDLDAQFGDVASALDLAPEFSLVDVVRGPAARDSIVLKTFLTLHASGLYVICAPSSPAASDSITGDDITLLLHTLAREFRYVVIDTAPGLSEHTLAALDATTDHVLLTSMDVPGVRGLRKEIDMLTDLGMLRPERHVVLNFVDARGGLSTADVEATIGMPVDLPLPLSPAARIATNSGIPLVMSGGRDPLTRQLRRLVGRFAGGESPREAERPSVWEGAARAMPREHTLLTRGWRRLLGRVDDRGRDGSTAPSGPSSSLGGGGGR